MATFTGTGGDDWISPVKISGGVTRDPPGADLSGNDLLDGLAGDDHLDGSQGADTLYGRGGDDTLWGDDGALFGADSLYGGAGNDFIGVFQGDRAFGGDGNDVLTLYQSAPARLDGGGGRDRLILFEAPIDLTGAAISGMEVLQLGDDAAFPNAILSLTASQLGGFEQLTAAVAGSEGRMNLTGGGTATLQVTSNIAFLNLVGSAGNETLRFSSSAATDMYFVGGQGRTDLVTGNGADIVYGGGGNDTLNGSGGNDILHGEDGFDRLVGGAGHDVLDGNDFPGAVNRADTLLGGAGNDTLWAFGGDKAYGEAGNDVIHLKDSTSGVLSGGGGEDRLLLAQNLSIVGATVGGIETLDLDGRTLTATANQLGTFSRVTDGVIELTQGGSATLTVTPGSYVEIIASNGDESFTLSGNGTTSTSYVGGAGNGFFQGVQGYNGLYGYGGNDTLIGGASLDRLEGGSGSDSLVGGGGGDHLLAQGGADTVLGQSGNDTIFAGQGNALFDGGTGRDEIDYNGVGRGISISLAVTGAQATGIGQQTLRNIEDLYGGAFADRLTGDGNANDLRGRLGNDTLSGGGGHDTLQGEFGNDLLSGGAGRDSFVFNPDGGYDVVTDWQGGIDLLRIVGFGAAFDSYAEVMAVTTQSGTATEIDLVSTTIRLENTLATSLQPSDFLFG